MTNSELKENHQDLEKILTTIPSSRTLTYREKIQNGPLIGKPRFRPALYEWDPNLLTRLKDHLQEIWNFFETNSYWFDDELKELLLRDQRRLSKKSVLFILERDVWETDEVYGEYLIEIKELSTEISYYRFGQKFRTFEFAEMDASDRQRWITRDAIQQVEDQFRRLWKRLEIEILTCQEQVHNKPVPLSLTDEILYKQHEKTSELVSHSREAALLMLGRLEELWILHALDRTRIEKEENLFVLAEQAKIVDDHNRKLFTEIRTNYNLLKHTTTYNIENCDVERLIKQFAKYVSKTN